MVTSRSLYPFLGLEPIQISGIGENLVAPWVKTEDFRQVMSLVYNADLFIGHDSGPSHIAASMEIPSVIFFWLCKSLLSPFRQQEKGLFAKSLPLCPLLS